MTEKEMLNIQQVIARAQKGGSFVVDGSGIEVEATVEKGGVRYSHSLNKDQAPMTQSVFLQLYRTRLFTEGSPPAAKKKTSTKKKTTTD